MSSPKALMGHLVDLTVIFVLGTVYVVWLAAGTALRFLYEKLNESVTMATDTLWGGDHSGRSV